MKNSSSFSLVSYAFLCFSLVLLHGCSQAITSPPALPQDQFIQVYFNQNHAQGKEYTDPYRHIKRDGDNLEKIILDQINSAQSSLDIAVQEIRLPLVAQALIKKQQSGVKIRVIIENTYNLPYSQLSQSEVSKLEENDLPRYQDGIALMDINKDGKLTQNEINQRDALVILKNGQVPLIDDTEDGTKGTGLMHHKFMIVDQKIVVTGSPNWTTSDIHGDMLAKKTRGNANNLLVINSPEVSQAFTEEFNLMWGDGMGGAKDSLFGNKKPYRSTQSFTLGKGSITVNFSPISKKENWELSSNGLISKTIAESQTSVKIALFVFSEQKIADSLQVQHNKGVEVKALIDPNFIYQNYSEALDLMGVQLSRGCRFEKDNHPWKNPINTVGVPPLEIGDKLHHKFALIDNYLVITGSHNWSASANYQNDETLLIINNAMVGKHYEQEFDRLYNNAKLGITNSLKKQLDQDKKRCH